MSDDKYTIQIFYSEEDEGYIAIAPELSGCSAFGETREKALEEIKIAMQLWLKVAEEDKELLPSGESKVA
jgi:predicted RNase H-like HicB family nuclease